VNARVLIADDGTEALRLLGTERIDVAVLDVMMPGPDGLTLCRSLRQPGGYPIPVILLTALGEEDDRISEWGHMVDQLPDEYADLVFTGPVHH
jgi:DNA-binding response OmpR family regulator